MVILASERHVASLVQKIHPLFHGFDPPVNPHDSVQILTGNRKVLLDPICSEEINRHAKKQNPFEPSTVDSAKEVGGILLPIPQGSVVFWEMRSEEPVSGVEFSAEA